jgi:hypothetical protein
MLQFSDYTFVQDPAASADLGDGTLLVPLVDVDKEAPQQLEVTFPDGRVSVFELSGQTYFVDTDSRVDEFVGWSYWEAGYGLAIQILLVAEGYDVTQYPGY